PGELDAFPSGPQVHPVDVAFATAGGQVDDDPVVDVDVERCAGAVGGVVDAAAGVQRHLHRDLAGGVVDRGAGFEVADEPSPLPFEDAVEGAADLEVVVNDEQLDRSDGERGHGLPVGVEV